MKRTLFNWTLVLLSLCIAPEIFADNGEGPCGVYLLVNGSSQNYRLTDTDWGNNSISTALNGRSQLSGVNLGTIKSLVLCGGQMTAYADGNDHYETNSFRVAYRVYKEGETAPDTWQELALDEETYRSGNDYRYEATDKTIDLRALTDGRGGVWKFEAKMLGHKYWNNGSESGSWDTNHDSQTASFYLPEHYYVAGNSNADSNNSWCGGSEHNWWKDYSGNEIISGSKTFTNVAAGEYEFKVTNGYWNDENTTWNEYTYEDLNAAGTDANVHTSGTEKGIFFTTDATSDITVHFDAVTGKISVTSTLGRFVRTPYSVVGEAALGLPQKNNTWDITSTATVMTRQDDGTYRFVIQDITLEAHNGRKFKIVGEHSWDIYQAPASGDFTVAIPAAGVYDLVFDFDPSTDLATCTAKFHMDYTISQYGYNTFFYDKAYEIPEGLTAKIATYIDDNAITYEEIEDVIPANTGVLLIGTPNQTYTFVETTTDVTYTENLFKGTISNTDINVANTVHYILSVNNGAVGMYWPYDTDDGTGKFTNQAHKAYLETSALNAPARRGFPFNPQAELPTGVESQKSKVESGKFLRDGQLYIQRDGRIYNAQGVRVQ